MRSATLRARACVCVHVCAGLGCVLYVRVFVACWNFLFESDERSTILKLQNTKMTGGDNGRKSRGKGKYLFQRGLVELLDLVGAVVQRTRPTLFSVS